MIELSFNRRFFNDGRFLYSINANFLYSINALDIVLVGRIYVPRGPGLAREPEDAELRKLQID